MHVGMWGLAAIVTVIASWLMYRYLAPQSWKEWTRVGVLQAFIIAFYAEMYGFPLTIYFLARFFGLDLAWAKGGNPWAHRPAGCICPGGLEPPAQSRARRTDGRKETKPSARCR